MKIKIAFSLDHESDTDIINYLDGMSSIARNVHIRQALRDHIAIERNQTTLKELYSHLEILINRIELLYATINPPKTTLNLSATYPDIHNQHTTNDNDMNEILDNLDAIGQR